MLECAPAPECISPFLLLVHLQSSCWSFFRAQNSRGPGIKKSQPGGLKRGENPDAKLLTSSLSPAAWPGSCCRRESL